MKTRLMAGLLLFAAAAGAAVARRSPTPAKAASTLKTSPALKASPVVRRWMKGMTLRDEVAQLIFIACHGAVPNSRTREYRTFMRHVRDDKIGGLILVNWSNGRVIQKAEPYALGAFINRMQRMARVPLMFSGDFERGASMRVTGTTVFPHAMAFGATGDPSFARYEGEVTAREARALGIQWVYYPVADVNNNPDNPIINIRSFGENPEAVAAHVKAFIEGAHSDKKNFVLTTAKHFPGHGDTAVDTHMNVATITADRDRLNHLELVPFKAAIEAGVDSVMTAHIAVPALAPADLPATLSSAILTDLLRKELGFKGLVVTDALEMGGIAHGYTAGEAAVRALEAGADALLMPSDTDAALKTVTAAVQSGRLTRARIQESVIRILAAKERVGLDKKRFVDLEAIGDVVDSPEANEKAQEIADRAVTLARNNGNLIPLAAPERTCYVTMPEGRFSTEGQVFTQEILKRWAKASVTAVDSAMSRETIDAAVSKLSGCPNFAVATFTSFAAYRGTVGMPAGELGHALEALISTGKPVALIALGNPYVLRNFPTVAAYLATFSNVPPSEIAAVKALNGEIAIRGHLPVSIPEQAKYGEGIQVPATASAPSGAATVRER
ncbi:MAG TPA: glycoside hydrolase family 3 N-terminal domain-containing protein [Candidatus Acidoferrales bacterium]|nr:glycoside hydrolase family 3 N-terminal domain-containing protein [Candidatus Acidoferrales bacterium]